LTALCAAHQPSGKSHGGADVVHAHKLKPSRSST
jgi:hypothetical protein